ncbi:KAP family P-loop NTPase fold protein [Methanohalophilus mahii]|uniref:KAP P-loop domain protein n=1 Tax=Methanohalophilus mahii (strain ATCC 35705 / DSM 5219 / SLP) TaxID=547558 RepID=D5E6N0_METMS|nr:P-loop NTPase fold protein [Methanohalophilus mahii]ADE36818.1 KAP P-loop domain protein [Methanohalophilus mahii DSM 5219]
MFIPDKPIETEKEDFLNRKGFSQHLAESLLSWKEKESLIVAVHGEWGSGKSSAIKLALRHIKNKNLKDIPTVIEFNPWNFSEQKNLSEHFFNEVAKEIKIRGESNDKKIAEKLTYYSSLLSLVPDEKTVSGYAFSLIIGISLVGISTNEITGWINIADMYVKYSVLGLSAVLVVAGIFKNYLAKLADILNKKNAYNKKSILEVKTEIKNELLKRQKKLIIVIDDIDRLNQSEIKQIFRLIRINADFPNIIYLLAFDRKIIEKNLEVQAGVSGKDYLNKIVQVDFDIPFAKPNTTSKYFFEELNQVLGSLPESAQRFYNQGDSYWANVYNSGFKYYFKNIRDVKRFMSSLKFNISQMYNDEIMEVNPIDFTAIEAIRVFDPDFYNFMKSQNSLFTSTDMFNSSNINDRIAKIENQDYDLAKDVREHTIQLVKTLFPQINTNHSSDFQASWSRDLRVCATSNFDSYFSLIPGGGEEEISQYEMENILTKTNSVEAFESILREYIEKNKIRKVLQKMQDYTSEEKYIPQEKVQNIVLALFNISDDLPKEKAGMFDYGADMDMMRILHQIFERNGESMEIYKILKNTIPLSKGLYGPVQEVSLQTPNEDRDDDPKDTFIAPDKVEELQKLCLEKIIGCKNKLLDSDEFIYIIYRWRDWDKEKRWEQFIDDILADDGKLVLFLSKFITESMSYTFGDYTSKRIKKLNYQNLNDFVELESIISRLIKIKNENDKLYTANKQTIDFYLANYDKKDNQNF